MYEYWYDAAVCLSLQTTPPPGFKWLIPLVAYGQYLAWKTLLVPRLQKEEDKQVCVWGGRGWAGLQGFRALSAKGFVMWNMLRVQGGWWHVGTRDPTTPFLGGAAVCSQTWAPLTRMILALGRA